MNSETVKRPFPVPPSAAEYKRAFEAIRSRLNDSQVAMLRAHYEAPGHRSTVQDLARKCGIESWRTVNRQYGEIAKRLLGEMGYDKPCNEDGELWLSGICFWYEGMEMFMRPEVVKALQETGIVTSPRPAVTEALDRLGIVETSGRSDEEMPDELRDVNVMDGETEVYSQPSEPVNNQKTTSSRIQPMLQAEEVKSHKMGSYEHPGDALRDAKRILVITGKGRLAKAAHSTIIRALDAGRSLDGGRIEDLSLLTQNIDGSYDLVELHGTINEARCLSCGHSYPPEINEETRWECPKCDPYNSSVIRCGRVLDDDDLQLTLEKAIACEFCIVAGSADVSDPAIRIAEAAKQAGAYLLECNEEETALSEIADGVLLLDPNHLFIYFDCLRRRQDVRDHDHAASADLPPDSNIQEHRTSESHPIRVDFINSREFPFLNRLGMTFAPGMSLLEESDLELLQLGGSAGEGEVIVLRFHGPADASVPESMGNVISIASKFEKKLRRGASVIAHCKDNPEMSPLAAACIAIAATDAGISASKAIELVREARPGAIENEAQEEFIADFEGEWREVMAKRGDHYLLYWQERSVLDHAANDLPLDVVASNGLFGVEEGDTLWIVTLTQERELFLAGRLVVGEIVEYEEAMRRMPDAGLWQAEYYAFPEPETEDFLRPVSLQDIAEELRFEGENDRLTICDGQINPQQLRKRRKLTPESAELVAGIWEESALITDPEELVVAWQEVVEENPDDPAAHYNLGVALDEVGRSEEAVREYQTTVRLDPNYFPALYNLGNYLLHSQQFDEAIEMFNRAILVDGDFAPVHFMLGLAYFQSGRFDDAVAATRQGLEVDPDDESAYYNIAYWTFLQGDYRGALARCDDVIAQFPFFTSPHVLKGICFRELGEIEKEIQSYKDAIDIKVDDEGAFILNFTAVFFLGAAWERKMTGSDAGIEYVEVDNHFDLEEPTHQFCWAMGHLAQGEREFAAQWIESLRTAAPDLARRLEAALNYEEVEVSKAQSGRAKMSEEGQCEEWPQQADLASENRPVELEGPRSVRKGKPRKQIQLIIGGTEITAKHNPDLYFQVLKMLVERGALVNLDLPIASGPKRNLLSSTPFHRDGSNFLAPVEFGGYYMESHSSREQGIKMLRAFLESLGIESSVLNEEDSESEPVVEFQIPNFRERVFGSMLGLAACDALGTTAEFKPTGSFPEITAMIGGGPFGLKPGEWTDDTSMALCLADSLTECDGFDANDQMQRYLRWKNDGYLSSNGSAFDIGTTINTALEKYQRQTWERNPFCGSISPATAGNGSLMRLAPVPIYYSSDPGEAIRLSAESSRTTHGARECIDACRYFAGLIIGALQGKTKDEILSASFSPVPGLWELEPLSDRVADIANGAFKSKKAPEISGPGQGYVVLSLHAALWAFYHTRSFREGALKVVNLGYDSDTYGAIYGQLAGAYYGRAAIPSDWLAQLARLDIIEHLANTMIRSH